MLDWLRVVVRKWLRVDTIQRTAVDDDTLIQFVVVQRDGPVRISGCVVGVAGLCLVVNCSVNGAMETRLIFVGQSLDKEKFWRLWKKHSGNPELTWE